MKIVFNVLISISFLTFLIGSSHGFDMVRDSNAKQFTQKVDHSKDDTRPVTNLQIKRPDNYPGNVAPQK